jgi:uncharacterized short protein YbdD (DUF466 family)
MRISPFFLFTIIILSGCIAKSKCQNIPGENGPADSLAETLADSRAVSLANSGIICQDKDIEILGGAFTQFGDYQGSTAELMLMLGDYFAKSPYVEHTLEHEPEALVVNLREFDCTTFLESCLAIARSIRSGKPDFEQFTSELRNIRYRNGIVEDYTSRIHYFSDWIYLNNQKQLIMDISKEVGGTSFSREVSFMSTHPDSYRQLAKDRELIEIIAVQEQKISAREMYFVSKDRIAELEADLKEGDIVGITTSISGLDIIHVGLLIRKSGRIHLLHASSRSKKVLISEEPLEDYLANNKSATGIMIARPL